ncbi:alpha/beta hydrolase [Alkanindiges sp. WGS2144]|uniref:alpha/beta hydrolase n=1 Tax=Alkanindiges sp. WGS2144 TaxID=3366808 RepID=UPI0037513ADA
MAFPEYFKRYAIEKILKLACKFPSQYHLPPSVLRQSLSTLSKSFSVHPDVRISQVKLGTYHAERHHINHEKPSSRVVLHIHGGVFFLGGPDTHRALASQMAAQTGATVYVLDYPLAPEYPCPAAMHAVKEAYMALIMKGYDAKNITISGDSCGGNLVLAAVLALRDENVMLPSAMVLMSPFLDLTLSGESMLMNQKLDAMLNRELLAQGSRYYAGEQYRLGDPLVSPLFADLSGLPPTLVQVGSKEILLDDANRFKALAEVNNSPVVLNVYPGMWHVFQMFSSWVDMAEQALVEIRDFIRHHTQA